jgi:DNA-directed RNA polymerase specialized sigma24 family protein
MRKTPRFEELFLPHLDAAYSLARWIVGRDQDAQDVVQEAYARAVKGFSLHKESRSSTTPLTGSPWMELICSLGRLSNEENYWRSC